MTEVNDVTQGQTQFNDMTKVMNLYSNLNMINQITDMKDSLKDNSAKIIQDENVLAHVEESIKNYGIDHEFTDAEIDEIFTVDGNLFVMPEMGDDEDRNFKKNFIKYMIETDEYSNKLDSELENLDKAIKEFDVDMKDVLTQYGDFSNFMTSHLKEYEKTAKDEATKNRITTMIQSIDSAKSLDRMMILYGTINKDNVIEDYNRRSMEVFERYMRIVKDLNIKSAMKLERFENFEAKFLEEKYNKYPNLMIFLLIRMISYKKDKANKIEDGVFISQFIDNLRKVYSKEEANAEFKEEFLGNVRKVLDLFIY